MVSTSDSDSGNPSSIPGTTSFSFLHFIFFHASHTLLLRTFPLYLFMHLYPSQRRNRRRKIWKSALRLSLSTSKYSYWNGDSSTCVLFYERFIFCTAAIQNVKEMQIVREKKSLCHHDSRRLSQMSGAKIGSHARACPKIPQICSFTSQPCTKSGWWTRGMVTSEQNNDSARVRTGDRLCVRQKW